MTFFVARESLPGFAGNNPGHFFVEVAIAVDLFQHWENSGMFRQIFMREIILYCLNISKIQF